uniref:Geminin coiled-coil domain containing n=1 Tax=Salarias fasciatus TaxID=181472 RepID=A0A672H8B6_SALFA
PAPPLMWMEQLSPHLQRNKQLQDTLLQREEELARLQEENNKLRHFLSSSFVRDLEQKAKKVTSDRRKLKRKLTDLQERSLKNCRPLQVSKRVCRNLTAQFNCSSSESSAYSEPNLDLWVLRTLGLKDRDTIDTSSQSSAENNLRALSSAHGDGRRVTADPARLQEANCQTAAQTPPGPTATGPSILCGGVGTSPALHLDPTQVYVAFSMLLSPSSSVKTHSFPQGQAFTRKDVDGRWNFTWVPNQGL